jgi:hypothetical protein
MSHKSIEQARLESDARHSQYLRNTTGAYYRQELGLRRIPAEYRATMASLPAVRLPSQQERQTDKFNLKDLRLTNLINLYIAFYQCQHHCLPSIISVSPFNMDLLEQLGFRHSIYRNGQGVFLLFCDTELDDNNIICS